MVHSLLSLLLMQSVLPSAWAQIGEGQTAEEGQTANDSLTTEDILIARDPYIQHEDFIVASGAGDAQTLSEVAQRRPVPVVSRRIRYPRGRGYGGTWRQPGNGRHALIGALIGFGIGAAIGAKGNQDQHTGARIAAPVLFGGAGALIGAAIGANHP